MQGSHFGYLAGHKHDKGHRFVLSFGDVIALAGDYYGNWGCKDISCTACNEQISDNYDKDPSRSITLFKKISAALSDNINILEFPMIGEVKGPGYLRCALHLMAAERKDVEAAREAGQDVSQVCLPLFVAQKQPNHRLAIRRYQVL